MVRRPTTTALRARMTGDVSGPPLLVRTFGSREITSVRHAVADAAAGAGLSGQRLDDFVLAVNEIATNAVEHAGGHGRLNLWIHGANLHCEVTDQGPGIPLEHLERLQPPPTFTPGGRGIWLARHLCDSVTVHTGVEGTTVAMRTTLAHVDGAIAR